ncbi:uncharacterized protein LOC144628007 isoform X2 [Oculina patagonica]
MALHFLQKKFKITFVDFELFETMDHHKIFEPSLLEPHKNLQELHTIALYLKLDRPV